MEEAPTSRFLFTEEAAEILRTTPYTVRKWVLAGKLPATRCGRRFLIDSQHLERLLHERTIGVS